MQTFLVVVTFLLALGFLLQKFVWAPAFAARKKSPGTLDGGKTKCGANNCQCH